MGRTEILRVLLNSVRDALDDDQVVFDESTPFDAIEDWDSASHVHIVVAMEKAFRIVFANSELQRLTRVADLVNIIERRVQAHQSAAPG